MNKTLLVDAREYRSNNLTGIGRVLTGLLNSVVKCEFIKRIALAGFSLEWIPKQIKQSSKISFLTVPDSFIKSELMISKLTRNKSFIFLSPYPKLPFSGTFCPSINIVHDIFYITRSNNKNILRKNLEILRLKYALKQADMTWFVSRHSMQQTKKLIGFTGRNPKLRYSGIDSKFEELKTDNDNIVLNKYNLQKGYILIIGNGKSHKNLGVLLKVTERLRRKLVFVGVPDSQKAYWLRTYPNSSAIWIEYVADSDLPAFYRNSFCLALPSFEEGFGFPPLEAMACGVPAVVSNCQVLKEITKGAALIADPDNPESWIESFKALEKNEMHEKLRDHGLKRALTFKDKKGWAKHVKDLQQFINQHQ